MYKFFKHNIPGTKVIEHVIARNKEEAAQTMMRYFIYDWNCSSENMIDVTPKTIESNGKIITWEEYQTKFQQACYWGYYDAKDKTWYHFKY